jgi:hypothetical protein
MRRSLGLVLFWVLLANLGPPPVRVPLAAQEQTPAPQNPAPAVPASSQTQPTQTSPTQPAPQRSTQSPAPNGPPAVSSRFTTRILAGKAINELLLFNVQPVDLARLPTGTITFSVPSGKRCDAAGLKGNVEVHWKLPSETNASETRLAVFIPIAPCDWPVYQNARIVITSAGDGQAASQGRLLFEGVVPVSVWWFPLGATLVTLAIVYPGCALVAWALARRRATTETVEKPGFLASLDPVQITNDAYGRASLSKLQIFGFSLVVFGLLLYYQFRNGILSGLSEDVLILLGISAVGTVGGRITYARKRRLSLDNWVWLRRKGWLPPTARAGAGRAKWRELIVDADSKEIDPYSFQMAIFSVVVAVALIASSLTGLTTFEIPNELLGLLGLSQIVFIGGKAAEKSPYVELDERLTSLRQRERKYQLAVAAAAAITDPTARTAADAAVKAERDAFKTETAQAADMFTVLYRELLPEPLPQALIECDTLEPETFG